LERRGRPRVAGGHRPALLEQGSSLVLREPAARAVQELDRGHHPELCPFGRVGQLGHAVMSAAIQLRQDHFPAAFLKGAA